MQHELAESALLGACLLNKKAPLIAAEYVAASDFFLPKHQLMWDAIIGIVARGAEVDPVTVAAELGKSVDSAYIFSLPSLCPAATNVRDYAASVRESSLDRQIRKSVEEAKQHTGSKLLADLQDRLYQLDKRVEKSVCMADVWQSLSANINKPLAPGCEYPWQKVQWLTRGMRPGWLCVLAGEPSHGKTACALAIAQKAVRASKRVVLISLEMDEEAVALRLAQKEGVNSDHYYDQKLDECDAGLLSGLAGQPYWKNLRLEKVERATQIGVVFRRWKPDLLIVDHLQLLAGSEDVKELSKTTRLLKLTAERFEAPILCLSQLSRAQGDDQNKLPRLNRLRGSGTIEQDADTVVFVWRKRDENETLTDESALVVAKSRMGRLGAMRTIFNGERQEFREITSNYGG